MVCALLSVSRILTFSKIAGRTWPGLGEWTFWCITKTAFLPIIFLKRALQDPHLASPLELDFIQACICQQQPSLVLPCLRVWDFGVALSVPRWRSPLSPNHHHHRLNQHRDLLTRVVLPPNPPLPAAAVDVSVVLLHFRKSHRLTRSVNQHLFEAAKSAPPSVFRHRPGKSEKVTSL